MSDTDDVRIETFAEALRSKANTPEFKAFAEDVIARMKRTPAYYAALGRFVTEFSRVETTILTSLGVVAGVPPPVAQAIFSGIKVEGCLQFIKRIADAKNWETPKKQRLEEISNRLGPINKLRNDILHYGVTLNLDTEDSWLLSNKGHVHIPEKIREMSITPSVLDDASSDLTKIFCLTIVLTLYDRFPDLAASTEKSLDSSLTHAWLYKPPPQAEKSDKSQKTPQKRARPRLSSRDRREVAMKKHEK